MKGTKHLIQCHCMLPQYKNVAKPIFHKFTVFSVLDDSDTVLIKYADCNNCGAVHKIYDICKSEIVTGRDEMKSRLSKDDFKLSLPRDLFEILGQYEKEVCDYEFSQFVIDNSIWSEKLVLSREEIDGHIQGKTLRFLEKDRFRIESYTHSLEF